MRASNLILIVLLILSGRVNAFAETTELSSIDIGGCRLSVEANIEPDEKWQSLRLRVKPSGTTVCDIKQQDMTNILEDAFSRDKDFMLRTEFKSLSIGRIIDYPWLSQYLSTHARSNKKWILLKERARNENMNSIVKSVLSTEEVLGVFREPFSKIGYDVISVGVEKVLVGKYTDIPGYKGEEFKGRAPFDAIMWVILKQK